MFKCFSSFLPYLSPPLALPSLSIWLSGLKILAKSACRRGQCTSQCHHGRCGAMFFLPLPPNLGRRNREGIKKRHRERFPYKEDRCLARQLVWSTCNYCSSARLKNLTDMKYSSFPSPELIHSGPVILYDVHLQLWRSSLCKYTHHFPFLDYSCPSYWWDVTQNTFEKKICETSVLFFFLFWRQRLTWGV